MPRFAGVPAQAEQPVAVAKPRWGGHPVEKAQPAAQVEEAAPQIAEPEPTVSPTPAPVSTDANGAMGSAALGAMDGASFGFADEIGAGINAGIDGVLNAVTGREGKSYEQWLEKNRGLAKNAEEHHPAAYLTGQVGGAVLQPGAKVKSAVQAVGHGAAAGAAYGAGSAEGGVGERFAGAGEGALVGGATGYGVNRLADMLKRRAARASIPTTQGLKTIAKEGYDAADAAGVTVKANGMQSLAADLRGGLAAEGYHPTLHPKVAAVVDEADKLSKGDATWTQVDTLRRIASNVAKSTDPSEARIGTQLLGKVEGYMENLPAADVLAGNADEAAAGFRKGQENWARFRRSEMVDNEAVKAERRAASTGSGGNVDNALRQNTRRILDNPRRSRGMSEVEKKAADRTVRGTKPQNAARLIGKLAPTGVVSGGAGSAAGAVVGSAVAGPAGAAVGSVAVPAIGLVAKKLADRATEKNVGRLSEIIRSGGKTVEELVQEASEGRGSKELVTGVQKIMKGEALTGLATARLAAILEKERAPAH